MQLIGRDTWCTCILNISSLLGIDNKSGGDEEEAEGQISRSSRVTTTTAMCIKSQDAGERDLPTIEELL